jgi:hypothetical protein
VTIAFTISSTRDRRREKETEARKAKVEGGILVSQQQAPSLIFA